MSSCSNLAFSSPVAFHPSIHTPLGPQLLSDGSGPNHGRSSVAVPMSTAIASNDGTAYCTQKLHALGGHLRLQRRGYSSPSSADTNTSVTSSAGAAVTGDAETPGRSLTPRPGGWKDADGVKTSQNQNLHWSQPRRRSRFFVCRCHCQRRSLDQL